MRLSRTAVLVYWLLILAGPIVGVLLSPHVTRYVAYGAAILVASTGMVVVVAARRSAVRRDPTRFDAD